jgi:hypothetical protein
MEFVDLSREIFHRTQTHPSHPPVVMTVWNDHSELKRAGNAPALQRWWRRRWLHRSHP